MYKESLKITKVNDIVIAKLYSTEIVRIDNNKISLNYGKYKTNLVKKNINKVLGYYKIPCHVFIHENEWKVAKQNGVITQFINNQQFNY